VVHAAWIKPLNGRNISFFTEKRQWRFFAIDASLPFFLQALDCQGRPKGVAFGDFILDNQELA